MKEKYKTWAELIESEKLKDVLEDIQMNIRVKPDSKVNKYIFKLLLYLSHTANKCGKENYTTGKEIAELAKLLCSLLIEVPDDKTFVISLYHIIRCLISLNLYEDAADVFSYLQLGNLHSPENGIMELLIKTLSLWRIPINNIYSTLTTKSLNKENYNDLKNIIKYEMKMIQIAYKDYTKHLIKKINAHLEKIATIDKETNIFFDDFCKFILEYLSKVQLYLLDNNEKYIIYYHILRIICRIVYKTINTARIGYAVKTLDELSSYFKDFVAKDEECHQCFQQFQNFCVIFLVPVENFTNDTAKDVQKFIHCNLRIAQKYGYTGGLMWNAFNIAEIVEPMFTYWETRVKTDKQQFLDTGIILEMMNLIIHTSVFFIKDTSSKCKACTDKECTVKTDIYNAVVMKCRCINLISRFPMKTLPKEVCAFARKILEQNVASIREMREQKCERWSHLWTTCGTLIYNMGVASEHVYEESAHFFSLLCTCIFQFQGTDSNSNSLTLFENISVALHRLSAVHYINGMYREAMTTTALNALLTYDRSNTKAFYMWINIKKKCASEKIATLTMLECLRNDKDKIYEMGLTIDTSKYDLVELCSREARSLLEEKIAFTNGVSAVLEEFGRLKPNNRQYARVIQLLGYYLLSFEHDSSILEYHERAISDLRQDKSNSIAVLCLEANLRFFTFVEELHTMNKKTHMEMESTRFALYAPKLPEFRETKSPNVVPAYTNINIKKDSSLVLNLQKSLRKWKQLLKNDIDEIIKNTEPDLILCMLITAGEYSRLYRYEDCEVEAWTLAYRLASKIDDHRTIIYVTGRSISLRQVNYDWIATAKEYATKHRDSTDESLIRAIAIFWISLADFYFECGKCDDAKELLTEARNLSGITFLSNTAIYLLSLDTIVRNCNLYRDKMSHEDYGSYIVESLYAMVNLSQDLHTKKCKSQAEYLFSYDVLFTTTVNLSVRVNSLLSFREISAHLVRRVKAAQSLGAVIRTAELLKSLCYIDLSRSKLDDCEVKLQGLEHILDIETFQLSMNSKIQPETSVYLAVTPTRIVDPVRDMPGRDASPILGKKIFDLPKFALHANCDCYKCGNASYRYLVFVTTYIRAQLYALQRHVSLALDHFYGAFQIRQKLFGEEESVLPENRPCDESGVKRFSWQARSYIIDYVHLLIDFCYFLKIYVTSKQQDALGIASLAINVCRKYELEGHPLYVSAKELALDNGFQPILEFPGCLEFIVPQPHDIDISNYVEVSTVQGVCVTPFVKNKLKKPFSVRRRKDPVILNLDVVSDEEDCDVSSPPVYSTRKPKQRTRLVRRKILEEDLSDDASSSMESSTPIQTKSKNCRTEDRYNTLSGKKSIKNVTITKVTLSVPDVSQNLMDSIDKSDVPSAIENINRLTEKMENLKVNSNTILKRKRATKNIRELTAVNYNKNINQVTELLTNVAINKKMDENTDSPPLIKIEEDDRSLSIQDHKSSEVKDEKVSIKTVRNEIKGARSRCARLLVNNEVHAVRTTRSNARKLKEKPS